MSPSINNPPPAIAYARLLYYAALGKSIRYSGCKLMFVGYDKNKKLKELKKVPCIAIGVGKFMGEEEEIQLIYCDKDWESIARVPYASIEDAMRRAERMYPGISALWIKSKVTKKQAKNYLVKLRKEEDEDYRIALRRLAKGNPSILWKEVKRKNKLKD
jgi:hypothetical protein